MKTNTRNNILDFIQKNAPISVKEISENFGISREVIHRHLKKLIEDNKIIKTGSPPRVFYFPNNNFSKNTDKAFLEKYDKERIIEDNFLYFSPIGEIFYGCEGFLKWCEKRKLEANKENIFYKKTLKKYLDFKDKDGFIDGLPKMKKTFEKCYLDEIYYLDFYSIEKYGKTLLGNLMFYGKQTSDKSIIKKILEYIKNPILNFSENNKIDSFAFIPPSIDRKVQILDELKKGFNFRFKELKLLKIFRDKVVSQKSLSKKDDRILNAKETIFLGDRNFNSKKILLIDDAVGSGATLNETAKKIKENNISDYVIGIAIVGSFKGFEVINEV